ncbi:hypothetical protein ACQEU3_32980 [Spirillospora sp. CA-253888]
MPPSGCTGGSSSDWAWWRSRCPWTCPPLSLAWHARYDEDAAHAWLRALVREAAGDGPAGCRPR